MDHNLADKLSPNLLSPELLLARRHADNRFLAVNIMARRESCQKVAVVEHWVLGPMICSRLIRDIAPIAGIARMPEVMVVNPSVTAKTVPEFIAYAKANPGRISFASAGNGTIPHVAGELFKSMTGVDLIRVGYRGGGPALIDLIGGQVQVMFETTLATLPYIRAGRLRALAVPSRARSPVLPDVPTVAEFVPGYEATAWYGLGAPKSISADTVEKLNGAINAGLVDPKIKGQLADLGGDPMRMTPGDFSQLIADETEKWAKVIRAAGIKAD